MIWHSKSFRRLEMNGMKIEWNDTISSIKDCVKIMKQEHVRVGKTVV